MFQPLFRRGAPVALCIATVWLSVPNVCFADSTAKQAFGSQGQIVIPNLAGVRTGLPMYFGSFATVGPAPLTESSLGWGGFVGYTSSNVTYTDPVTAVESKSNGESLWIAPSFDVFVKKNWSLGVAAAGVYATTHLEQPNVTDFSAETVSAAVAPRLGYVVPIGGGLSLWPRVTLGASYAETHYSGGYGWPSSWTRAVFAGAQLGIVYQPHKHIVVQLAPEISGGRAWNMSQYPTESAWVRLGGEATAGVVF